jgi:hypothetical protein
MRERKPFRLGLDPALYNPEGLKAVMEESGVDAVAREYSRLRREATQRLTRLGRSEFADSKAYTENKNRFVRLDQIDLETKAGQRRLARLTQEAARFVTARGSSASGLRAIRREAIDKLHDDEYKWVNTKNFKKFTEFMDDLRAEASDKLFYAKHPRGEIPLAAKKERARELKKLFDFWLKNGESLKDPETGETVEAGMQFGDLD